MFLTVFIYINVSAQTPIISNCKSYILVNAEDGRILTGFNEKMKCYPASTVKIMTAILALENSKLDTIMTASRTAINAIGEGGMNVGILEGEYLTLATLLILCLIKSANETVNIIANMLQVLIGNFVTMSE